MREHGRGRSATVAVREKSRHLSAEESGTAGAVGTERGAYPDVMEDGDRHGLLKLGLFPFSIGHGGRVKNLRMRSAMAQASLGQSLPLAE